jgi:hypothetical protein
MQYKRRDSTTSRLYFLGAHALWLRLCFLDCLPESFLDCLPESFPAGFPDCLLDCLADCLLLLMLTDDGALLPASASAHASSVPATAYRSRSSAAISSSCLRCS